MTDTSAGYDAARNPKVEDDPDMNIRVKCEHCKSVFAMTDRGSRVLNALRAWDSEHKHKPEAVTL